MPVVYEGSGPVDEGADLGLSESEAERVSVASRHGNVNGGFDERGGSSSECEAGAGCAE